eukprot:2375319-Amphidinium_carterae.2
MARALGGSGRGKNLSCVLCGLDEACSRTSSRMAGKCTLCKILLPSRVFPPQALRSFHVFSWRGVISTGMSR